MAVQSTATGHLQAQDAMCIVADTSLPSIPVLLNVAEEAAVREARKWRDRMSYLEEVGCSFSHMLACVHGWQLSTKTNPEAFPLHVWHDVLQQAPFGWDQQLGAEQMPIST